MTLGKRIAQLRIEKELTQEELAECIGISRGSLSMYEIDKREPDNSTIKKMASYFNVSIDYLMGQSDIRNPYSDENNGDKIITKAYHNLDTAGLSAEDIEKVEEYIEFLKQKYNPDGSLKKK